AGDAGPPRGLHADPPWLQPSPVPTPCALASLSQRGDGLDRVARATGRGNKYVYALGLLLRPVPDPRSDLLDQSAVDHPRADRAPRGAIGRDVIEAERQPGPGKGRMMPDTGAGAGDLEQIRRRLRSFSISGGQRPLFRYHPKRSRTPDYCGH